MSASAAQQNRERQIHGIEIRLESSGDQESRISNWLGRAAYATSLQHIKFSYICFKKDSNGQISIY